MNPALIQKALQIAQTAAKNKKFIEGLKFIAQTKWASRNLLKETPLKRFLADPHNPRKLLPMKK